MNTIYCRAIIKVAESGSITKAANLPNYSQSNISHMMTSFEKEIGFPVFIRNKDFLTLTESGKKILAHCYHIVNEENELKKTISSINGLTEGKIKIGALNSMLVDFVPLFDLRMVVIMHEDHPLSEYEIISLKQLNSCNFIVIPAEAPHISNYICRGKDFKPNIQHYTASDMAAVSMVSHNLGVYIISPLQERLLPNNVISRPIEVDFVRKMGMAIKPVHQSTPAIKELMKTVKKYQEIFAF